MAPSAGFLGKFGVTTSSTTMTASDYVQGVTSQQFSRVLDMLDTTNHKDAASAGDREFIAGLRGGEVNITVDLEPTGDTPTTRILDAFTNRTTVWAQVGYNATPNGWKVESYVESIDIKAGVADKLTADVKFRLTGAVSTF